MWYEEADVKAESKEGKKLEKCDRTRSVMVWRMAKGKDWQPNRI